MPLCRLSARWIVSCLLLFLIAIAGAGEVALAAPPPATFTATVAPAVARPGETVTVTVTADIKAPWHVYSVVPVPDGPAATSLLVSAGPLKPVGGTTESAPKKANDPNFGKEVGYHEGTATFTQRLQVPPDTRPRRACR